MRLHDVANHRDRGLVDMTSGRQSRHEQGCSSTPGVLLPILRLIVRAWYMIGAASVFGMLCWLGYMMYTGGIYR